MKMQKTIVVGAGINGIVAAIELRKRGHDVVLIDPGPVPHPLAASTDISKSVRAAYGADEDYTALAEQSREIWRQWNVEFGVELYHEIGFLFMRQRSMQPGDFEYESFKVLERRGHRIERISSKQLLERFPAWNGERYPDGFLDLEAGYAESGRVVATLIRRANSLGVEFHQTTKFRDLDETGGRVKGILLENGESWVRPREVAGCSRARGDEGGGRQNAPIFVRLISGAGGCANRIHAHLLVLRYP